MYLNILLTTYISLLNNLRDSVYCRVRKMRLEYLLLILEIRVSQNLTKLGGEAHKGWEDRKEMK